jgi:hypothetical protein
MIPTNSKKFSKRDLAIRFRISARSVYFPPLFEVGVGGGVYSCWIPCSSRLGNGSFICHTYESASFLFCKPYNLRISVIVDSGVYARYTDPQNTCKCPRQAVLAVVDIAARRGGRGVGLGARSRDLVRLWRMKIGLGRRAERRLQRDSRR